jgi:hypothetical protein
VVAAFPTLLRSFRIERNHVFFKFYYYYFFYLIICHGKRDREAVWPKPSVHDVSASG